VIDLCLGGAKGGKGMIHGLVGDVGSR